jgi:hypothetical protein
VKVEAYEFDVWEEDEDDVKHVYCPDNDHEEAALAYARRDNDGLLDGVREWKLSVRKAGDSEVVSVTVIVEFEPSFYSHITKDPAAKKDNP